MNIDRVARAMTAGRPRVDFTARVMAPIQGRPRPGFTARVMAQADIPVDDASASRGFRPAFAAALVMPAAIAIAAALIAVRGTPLVLPPAPRLATAPVFNPGMAAPPNVLTAFSPAKKVTRVLRPVEEPVAQAEPPPIYMIDALEGPAHLAMKPIEPAAFTIPALDGPAPLRVIDLPALPGGSPSRDPKEKR